MRVYSEVESAIAADSFPADRCAPAPYRRGVLIAPEAMPASRRYRGACRQAAPRRPAMSRQVHLRDHVLIPAVRWLILANAAVSRGLYGRLGMRG